MNSVDPGDEFADSIRMAVESCDVLLALIGPSWLELAGPGGKRRIDDPNDYVRIEIEAALRRGIRVIPILIDETIMPTGAQLPVSLAQLSGRQALGLSATRFMGDTINLIKVIEKEIAASRARQHQQSISRRNPGCIIFLLDRSESMGQAWEGGESIAEGAARAINDMLTELVLRSQRGLGHSYNYFDIGIFGYGELLAGKGEGVESAFGGALAGRGLVPVSDVRNNPVTIRKLTLEHDRATMIRAPIWVEPMCGQGRPMCQAIAVAGAHAFDWAEDHPESFPPVIINITNGTATDSPYEGASLDLWAQRLAGIKTRDGSVLFFNVFLSSEPGAVMFPATDGGLPDPGPELFRISSMLPSTMIENGEIEDLAMPADARGLVFNADYTMLIKLLEMGTRVGRRG